MLDARHFYSIENQGLDNYRDNNGK